MDNLGAIVITTAGAVAVALISGLAAWFVARRTAKPVAVQAEAAVQTAINDGFAKLAGQYEAMNKSLQAKADAQAQVIDEYSAKIDQLTGEVRDLTQHVESLESALRREGLPVPARRKHPHPLAKPPLVGLRSDDAQEG